jgi:type I restriction enzyme S subunit
VSGALKLARLDSLVVIVGGGTPSKANPTYFNGAIPWVTPKDMQNGFIMDTEDHISQEALENSSTRLVPPSSVLVVVRSGVLKHRLPIALNGVPVAINQDMKALICNSDVHPTYLAYVLKCKSRKLLQRVRGTTADNIPVDELKALPIPVPPISEQKRIAAILDKADAIRRKRQQAIELADEFLGSLFLDMFGDPIRNPKGWPVSSFGDQLELIQYGPRFYNQPYSPDGIRIVRITDVGASGDLNFDAMPRFQARDSAIKSFALKAGDLIFARSGSVGKTAVIEEGFPPCIAGAYFMRLRFKDAVRPHYARRVLSSRSIQRSILERSRQSIQPNFSGPALKRLQIPLPPISLQDEFHFIERAVRKRVELCSLALKETEMFYRSALKLVLATDL